MQPSAYTDDVISDLGSLIKGLRADQMSNPTPCAKWTVHDLVNHVVGGGHTFAAAFRGEALPGTPEGASDAGDADAMPDLVGNDATGAYDRAIADYRDAIGRPGAAERMVTLPFAEVPGQMAMDIAAVDLLVHSWDLARATGQSYAPSPGLVEAANAFARMAIPPEARDGNNFAAAIPAPASASPLEQLVAFTGRQP